MEPLLDNRRNEPTARCHGRTFRRGADVSQKSSLPLFLLIGLAVGLFAFGTMTFCVPDPFAKIAAREAAAAQTFPPPVFRPVEVAPPIADLTPPAPPAQITVTTIAPPPAAKPHAARRSVTAKKANPRTPQLPSNPYAN